MESQGSFSPTSNPGRTLLDQAKRLAELPEFQFPGAEFAHFDWDRDLIVVHSAEYEVLKQLPLRATLEQYKDKL